MTLRDDLRGVSRVDLACAALMVPVLLWGAAVGMQETPVQETHVPQETPVQEAGDAYAETWEWCIDRFPGKPEMQEACQWGAYEMLPAIPMTQDWSA